MVGRGQDTHTSMWASANLGAAAHVNKMSTEGINRDSVICVAGAAEKRLSKMASATHLDVWT